MLIVLNIPDSLLKLRKNILHLFPRFIIMSETNEKVRSLRHYGATGVKRMLRAERLKEIVEIVKKDKAASVSKLAAIFAVHQATIRRDLAEIEERGLLIRTHGGVMEDDITSEPPFSERAHEQYEEKQRIGLKAAELIGDDEHVIIDSGTTTLHIAKNLHDRSRLTIITNDMNVASELRDATGVKVIVTGGTLTRGTYMLNGMYTQRLLETLHVQKAFIGTPAVHPLYGLTHPEAELVPTKQFMIQAAKQIIVVADHTKIGKVSLHTTLPVQKIDTVITGIESNELHLQSFRDTGVEVITA
jgi:DeoR family fructose operon transcriptional repressor